MIILVMLKHVIFILYDNIHLTQNRYHKKYFIIRTIVDIIITCKYVNIFSVINTNV